MKTINRFISMLLSLIFLITLLIIPINAHADGQELQAGIVSVSSGKLNVRKSNSTSSAIVKTLKKGRYITLISKKGNWWYVKYGKDKFGYTHKNYTRTVSSETATVNIQSDKLNVRKGPSTDYAIKATLSKGDTVVIISTSGTFKRVVYNGIKTGYVSEKYLSKDTSASQSSYSKILLDVPRFEQTDSRWANVKIGSSGKTIAKIGCATTAIAMMESYRNNKTIYPDAMSKKLSYSSSGDLYWPSDYTVVTSSSGALKAIYNKLKQNKPVLFGAKTSSGRQHWVVVTGYKGGSTLSASDFTINDPGSASRKTLNKFLNDYPKFYKFFYY